LAVFMLALGAGWNGGNVGPLVDPLADEFSVSLSAIGLLSGTVFFGGIVAALIFGSALARRIPIATGLRACCAFCIAGNAVCAASPWFAGLAAGRILAGVGLGFCFLFGAPFARAAGGLKLLGVFGAGITLGAGGALGLGSLLEDGGVDWRWAFVLSAVLAALPFPLLPGHVDKPPMPKEPSEGLLREAYTKPGFWRLQSLGISSLPVPLVIAVWLVHYLVSAGGMSTAAAGGLSFLLFGLSAIAREAGGRLSAAGTSQRLLVCGGMVTGAAGIAILAFTASFGAALLAVVLQAIGLGLPYPLFYDEAERILPDRPLAGMGLLQIGANAFPIPVVPLVGAALASGDEKAAFLGLAGFVALTAVLNLKPAVPSEAQPAMGPSAAPG
jgi:predicted MFS family arabinose efflux permease